MAELLLFPASIPPPAPGPASTLTLNDREARLAALDIHSSWIVEAPAGSGKTGLLIQRYLKLLAQAEIYRPEQVLILTFTRKADGELRSRVLEQLTAAAKDQPLADPNPFDRETRDLALGVLSRDRALGWRILDSPGQLNIRTIDSFCADLAASTPLLSPAGRLQPVDDASSLYEKAAEQTITQLGGPDGVLHEALTTLLLHRDAQVANCVALLAEMLAQREQWAELLPLDRSDLTDEYLDQVVRRRLDRTLEGIIATALRRAAGALGPNHLSTLAHTAAALSTEPGFNDAANPLACCAGLRGAFPDTPDFLPHWQALADLLLTQNDTWRKQPSRKHLGIDFSDLNKAALNQTLDTLRHHELTAEPQLRETLAAVRHLPPARYPEDQWIVVKALCRILAHALVALRAVFAQRNQCDFTEIALTARALLRPDSASPDLFDLPQTRHAELSHLLVDEMQDTSAGQYQLLESLTDSWDGFSQTIFLVGDPKQSIYAFRQARVERFLRTMTTGRLGDRHLGPLRLTANFRSQSALVDAFNTTFGAIFPGPGPTPDGLTPDDLTPNPGPGLASGETAAIPFVAATPARRAGTNPALHWHAHFVSPDAADSGSSGHPRQIRSLIEDFVHNWPQQRADKPQRPPRIAVLARNRAHLAPIVAEFQTDRGRGPLLFRAVDVEALAERPEILDLLALTRALLHPADRVAWLAILRSPVCGLTLADLLALTGEGPEAAPEATVTYLVATRAHRLSAEGQRLLRHIWPTLLAAQDTLGAIPFSLHVERTWRTLGADAPLRSEQIGNCYRFLNLLRTLETGPEPITLATLNRALKKLYAEPPTLDTPVELMTIHKAKGLEWDLVVVPALDRSPRNNTGGLLRWLEIDSASTDGDLLLAPMKRKGHESTEIFTWLGAGEHRREVAEAQRLLYVACTRAAEELHLFATVKTASNGSLCEPRSGTLLHAAWPAANIRFEQQQSSAPAARVIPLPLPRSTPEPLSLAAAADPDGTQKSEAVQSHSTLRRLPETFDRLARFTPSAHPAVPYPPAANLRQSSLFLRPEGSFAARAFGNVVHRFLQLLADRLGAGTVQSVLASELATWHPRLLTALRAEGLPSTLASKEAYRAITALEAALADPHGAWLLGPRTNAQTEVNLLQPDQPRNALRADRTFFAGPLPLSTEQHTHLWITDYKTAELGGRSLEAFLQEQKRKYLPQMQTYAQAAADSGTPLDRIVLALYFPLLPALLHWSAANQTVLP